MRWGGRRVHTRDGRTATDRRAAGKSTSAQAAEQVATAAIGGGLLSFACIACLGGVLGAFSVATVVGALISPWTLLAAPVVAYALWRWQRYRLECRVDPARRAPDSFVRPSKERPRTS